MFQRFSRMSRRGLRTLLASSATLGLTLGLAPGASATAPAASRPVTRPALAPAIAGPVCTTVDGYLGDLGGRLYRTTDAQPLTGKFPVILMSHGWGGNFMGPKVVKSSHYDQVAIIQSFAGISTLAPIVQ